MTEAFKRGFIDYIEKVAGLLPPMGDSPGVAPKAGATVVQRRSGAPSANTVNPWSTPGETAGVFGSPGAFDVNIADNYRWQADAPTAVKPVNFQGANRTIGARTTLPDNDGVLVPPDARERPADIQVSVRRRGAPVRGTTPASTVLARNSTVPAGYSRGITSSRRAL